MAAMSTHDVLVLILAIIVAAFGIVTAVMAAPPRPGNPSFWAGLGLVAAGVALIIVAVPQIGG
jgi:hypothetical protein